MYKPDCIQDQMSNVSREMEILRKNQKEMPEEVKNTVTKVKNVFDGLISRPDTDEESIYELEDISIETSQTESSQKKKTEKTE